ncbi:pyridoxamine 5'-phosphate oxidase family protein [Gordonia sihwensis]|uniref:pyridoxamine 5'-phosphate oxidase family protein n=1 Tax=Gordonia sihwensis TaxID=173559 RepID=UPI0005EF55B8|nr:pyridoxamine 5'-phosphate oxidase family protein [Gordonia sihwensis]KJR07951.1 hypothetical protein UG54_09185 [Gordonia sihwensis]MBY4569590.1 hypothetical protein [Gordonia sihwensis]
MENLTRKRDRQSTDRDSLDRLLDQQWWGVLSTAFGEGGTAAVRSVPTLHVRDGDRILLHGSTGAGVMGSRRPADQRSAFCVTAMDALVLANSTFDSTVHFRSAVVYGRLENARADDRAGLLTRFTDLLTPGRNDEVRPMTKREIAATNVTVLRIEEGEWVYKANAGDGVVRPDDEVTAWCGVIPFTSGYGVPRAADWSSDRPLPESVRRLVGV